jgi:uncharacterized coiled-coil protein SlyX
MDTVMELSTQIVSHVISLQTTAEKLHRLVEKNIENEIFLYEQKAKLIQST